VKAAVLWLATVLGVALLAHLGSIWYAPRYIMGVAMDRLAAEGSVNAFIERPLADAGSRDIVRPSPDLMYSVCVVDVSAGPVRIRAPASTPYTSVSVFAANSDNIFVMNDQALAPGADFDIWVGKARQKVPVSAPSAVLRSERGIVLIRRVVTDAEQAKVVDALRREARCERK
jgi:uncharacterized membrane protein